MKVLYISPYYSNSFIHNQICKLSKYNVDSFTIFPINLYLYLRKSAYRQNFKNPRLSSEIPAERQKKIFYYGLPQNMLSEFYPIQISKKIQKLIRNQKFDLIHAHTLFPTGTAAMYLAEELKIPYLISSHGFDFYRLYPKDHELTRGNVYREKERVLIKKTVQKAKKIVCVSHKFTLHFQSVFPEANVVMIENSYNHELFHAGPKNEARRNLQLPSDLKIILSVGNFITDKGHKYLLQAMRRIKKEFPNSLLILVGKGALKKTYLKLIKEYEIENKVKLVDHLPQNKLADYYRAADVFVLPSLNEAFGLALVEAMACGVPSIATRTQGPSQIIENNKNGILVETKKSVGIYMNIVNLFQNMILYNRIKSNSIFSVQSKYKNKESELIDLYEGILK